jgi:glycosyltransferase involved in cell wall biosynthesis
LVDHPVDGISERWLSSDADEAYVRNLLSRVRGIIFFERFAWHPHLLRIAREMKVATVCVPMWEWFKGEAPEWQFCDLFVCPTRFTEGIVRRYGWTNTCVLPWSLDLSKFADRSISGPGRLFIHNAGLVDHDDRKGTRDTILAFRDVSRRDIRLIVRVQKKVDLPESDDRIEVQVGNFPNVSDLYSTGDVCIQPSKMEGIGFMVVEAVCCGIPVITTDYPPMNEFVVQPELRCATRWFRRKAFPSQWISHAHLKVPRRSDLRRRIEWAASHDLAEVSRQNRHWAETTFDKANLNQLWSGVLGPLVRRESSVR